MKAHSSDPYAARFGAASFEVRHSKDMSGADEPRTFAQCSYCGSVSVADAIKAMKTPGTRYSGSDWKYGWPHKFYLDIPCEPHRFCCSSGPGPNEFGFTTRTKMPHKFYAEHFADATEDEIVEWNRDVFPLIGVAYDLHDGRFVFWAPRHWQTWGTVGEERPTQEAIDAEWKERSDALERGEPWHRPELDNRFGPPVIEANIEALRANGWRVPRRNDDAALSTAEGEG